MENAMHCLRARLGSFAALLAISGAALANPDGAVAQLPEPGVLELMAIAGVISWFITHKRGRK